MLNVYFGDMLEAIYDTAVYFKNTYKGKWITSELSRDIVKDVDKSEVVGENLIQSPVLGAISPLQLSRGIKTLLLINYDNKHVFNASSCGDNCAKWLLKIAEDKKVVVNLRHLMDFGNDDFKIRVLNNNSIVRNMGELLDEAGELV